jgi:hypothetical protein
MREISLVIKNEEDIVFLEQGLNWIRKHILVESKEYLDLIDRLPKSKGKFLKSTLDDHIRVYDSLMSLIAQLDKHLEKK